MAVFDFPASPTEGQEFTPPGGPTYVWRAPAWQRKSGGGGGGAATFVGVDPPASPTPGMLWFESDSGRTYIWYDDGNTQQWVQVSGIGESSAAGGGDFLPLAGGELSGNLTIANALPTLVLKNPGSGGSLIHGMSGANKRWELSLGDGLPESGANAGSNFQLASYADNGALLNAPLAIERASGNATLRGNLHISKPSPAITFDKTASGQAAGIRGQLAGKDRWGLYLGDAEPETGSNAGSDLALYSAADDGSTIAAVLRIKRANSVSTFAGNITVKKQNATITLDTPGDATTPIYFAKDSIPRWAIYKHLTAEGAGNTGQELVFDPYTDAGVGLGTVMSLSRTGVAHFPKGQLRFPAVQNPSTDLNTLDDYEEGTFVPALAFSGLAVGITYGKRLGTYRRVGSILNWWVWMVLTSKGTSVGVAQITGLPFISAVGADYYSGAWGYGGGVTGMTIPSAMVIATSVTINLYNAGGVVMDTNFTGTASIGLAGSYEVA